jgi:hypothetical protein
MEAEEDIAVRDLKQTFVQNVDRTLAGMKAAINDEEKHHKLINIELQTKELEERLEQFKQLIAE